MTTTRPARLTFALGALLAGSLALSACSATEEPAPTAEAVTAATAVATPTPTPTAEPTYAEQVEAAWLEGWSQTEWSTITQPAEGVRLVAYITEVRSDAPDEVTAVISPPEAPTQFQMQELADRELKTIRTVDKVNVSKLTVTTADGSLSASAS